MNEEEATPEKPKEPTPAEQEVIRQAEAIVGAAADQNDTTGMYLIMARIGVMLSVWKKAMLSLPADQRFSEQWVEEQAATVWGLYFGGH